jgi:hypothetical protein
MGNLGKTVSLVFVALFLVSLVTVSSAISADTETIWNIQTMDKTSGGPIAVAIDTNNNPHILYGHYQNGSTSSPFEVIYASWNGTNWNKQTVPFKNIIANFIDSEGNPHFLYQSTNRLIYAWWTGTNWTQQTVTNEGYTNRCVLALDSSGNPHLAYTTDLGNPQGPIILKYASWTGTNWSIQNVDSYSSLFQYSSMYLGLDSNGNPHIMYGNVTQYPMSSPNGGVKILYSVKFAEWNGSAWKIQTAFSHLSRYGNMALDSKGHPHFIYTQDYPISHGSNSTLFYVSWNGSAWNSQTVVSDANLGDGSSFALDAYDFPHIDFCNGTSEALVYAYWAGNAWDFQTVGPNNLAIEAGPLAIDSKGNVHITYSGDLDGFMSFGETVYIMYAKGSESIYTPIPSTSSPSSIIDALVAVQTVVIALVIFLMVVVVSFLLYRRHRKKANLIQ